MHTSFYGVYSLVDAPTASFIDQSTWVNPLVVTDVIWESIPKTVSSELVGYCHESQTDYIHMSRGGVTFVLMKDDEFYKIPMTAGDGKVLIIEPNVWHSAVNLVEDDAIFLNMAKRHAEPMSNDFTKIIHKFNL